LLLAAVGAVGTVAFGILAGMEVAVALSLLEMAQRLARPHEGVLGRVPGIAGMHDVDDYPDAQTLPGLVVHRYDAPLFLANVGDLRRRALLAVEQENAAFPEHPVHWFVLNTEANVEVDITAVDGLHGLHADLAERGVVLGLARVKHDLLVPLERAGLTELIGPDMPFPTCRWPRRRTWRGRRRRRRPVDGCSAPGYPTNRSTQIASITTAVAPWTPYAVAFGPPLRTTISASPAGIPKPAAACGARKRFAPIRMTAAPTSPASTSATLMSMGVPLCGRADLSTLELLATIECI
jgi:MFS superfamily sulfate permease-like transporter